MEEVAEKEIQVTFCNIDMFTQVLLIILDEFSLGDNHQILDQIIVTRAMTRTTAAKFVFIQNFE